MLHGIYTQICLGLEVGCNLAKLLEVLDM
jgi:hypothetical protein